MRSVDLNSLLILCGNSLAICAAVVTLLVERVQRPWTAIRQPTIAFRTHGLFLNLSHRSLENWADSALVKENFHDK